MHTRRVCVGRVCVEVITTVVKHSAAVVAHDSFGHGPGLFVTDPLDRLLHYFPNGFSVERRLVAQHRHEIPDAHHRVVYERVTGDRRADDGPVAVFDRSVAANGGRIRSVQLAAKRHHARVQHRAAELPEQRQLHGEPGQQRMRAQIRALERRTLQTLFQADVPHFQSVIAVGADEIAQASGQR